MTRENEESRTIVRTVALLRRKDGMTFREFDDYWRNTHAPLAGRLPGVVRYVQRHFVPDPETDEPDNGYGLDGIVVLDYEDADAMDHAWASEPGKAALADVDNFLGMHYVVTIEDVVVTGSDFY